MRCGGFVPCGVAGLLEIIDRKLATAVSVGVGEKGKITFFSIFNR
jgi:hypothetical protein